MRIQAVVTELVFEHALRIRMKAETTETIDASKSGENTAVATPDTASQVGERDSASDQDQDDVGTATTSTAHSTAPSSSAKDKGKGKDKLASESAPSPKSSEPAKAAGEKKGKKAGSGDGGGRVGGEGDKQGCREEKTKGGTRRDRGRDGCLGEGPARPEGETREVERGRRTRLALAEKEEADELVLLALLLLEANGLVYGVTDALGCLLLCYAGRLLLLGLVDGGTEGGGEGIAVLG